MNGVVYILLSLSDNRTYVGLTNNFARRLKEHNSGKVRSTKHRIPFKILFTEQFETLKEARKRENWWKSGVGRRKLKEYFQKNKSDHRAGSSLFHLLLPGYLHNLTI
jgi:putative endonuclease